jgi:hypothetical protein
MKMDTSSYVNNIYNFDILVYIFDNSSNILNKEMNPDVLKSMLYYNLFLPFLCTLDIGLPRQTGVTGEYLPSARTVSNVVHNQDPCCPLKERDLSLYVMQWGQMIDHDLTDTAIARGANDATVICCNLTKDVLMQR